MATTISLPPTETIVESLNMVSPRLNPIWMERIQADNYVEREHPVRYADKGSYVRDYREINNVLQPYLGDFAPKSTIAVGSVKNDLQFAQIDLLIKATDLAKWLKTRYPNYSQVGQDPLANNFVSDFLNKFVIDEISRELQRLAFFGVRQERTEGNTSAFLTTFDGYDKKITDLLAAQKLNEVVVGALTANDIVNQVQLAMEQIPSNIRYAKGQIKMSKTWATRYSRRYKALHEYAERDQQTKMVTVVDDYQVEVVGLQEMEGLNYFIVDIFGEGESNMITVQDDMMPAMPVLRFEKDKRNIAVMGEMARCYGFERSEWTFISAAN